MTGRATRRKPGVNGVVPFQGHLLADVLAHAGRLLQAVDVHPLLGPYTFFCVIIHSDLVSEFENVGNIQLMMINIKLIVNFNLLL